MNHSVMDELTWQFKDNLLGQASDIRNTFGMFSKEALDIPDAITFQIEGACCSFHGFRGNSNICLTFVGINLTD